MSLPLWFFRVKEGALEPTSGTWAEADAKSARTHPSYEEREAKAEVERLTQRLQNAQLKEENARLKDDDGACVGETMAVAQQPKY